MKAVGVIIYIFLSGTTITETRYRIEFPDLATCQRWQHQQEFRLTPSHAAAAAYYCEEVN